MKKKGLETILYSAGGVLAMAAILIAANVITSAVKARVDLTDEKLYTLSKGTRDILRSLDTPIKVRFYFSQPETSGPEAVFLKSYAKRVEDLLAEYKKAAGGKLIVEKYDPQPDSDAEDRARLDGVEPNMLQSGDAMYLGLSVSMLDERQTIPFLQPNREAQLEYDLSRAITRVSHPEKPVIGIMSAMPVFGMPANPMMRQMGQQPQGQEPWVLVNELRNDFEVRRVEMTAEKIDDDVKVLMVIHPREITEKSQFAIDQFILRGGKLMAFIDPLPLIDSREQNQMFGSIPNSGSNLDKLMKSWGLTMDTGKVVADLNLKMQIRGQGNRPQEAPAFLQLAPANLDKDDIITSEITSIWLPFAGAITGTPATGLTRTVLLKSTKDSQLVEGFMANLSGENVIKEFKSSGTEQALAVRLTGKFKTAFPDGPPAEPKTEENKDEKKEEKPAQDWLKESKQENTVVIVADADFLFDAFSLRQMQTPFGNMATPMNGNLTLAQNAAEQLTGDNNLITVRSRAVQNRPFTVVKKMQAEAESRYRSKIKELEDSLADTQRQLNELQQKKEAGQRFILSPEQQQTLETFRKKEGEVKVKLKDERKELRREIDSLQNRLKWLNIAAVPLLVSISGITLAYFKRKRTSAK
jgi:ABC-type uncharacterized transport system involved in gliding motility auxiliary subunit